MDYTFQIYKTQSNYKIILYRINRIRMYKSLLLLFELVRVYGMQATNAYYNNDETSVIRWKFMKNSIEKPINKDY